MNEAYKHFHGSVNEVYQSLSTSNMPAAWGSCIPTAIDRRLDSGKDGDPPNRCMITVEREAASMVVFSGCFRKKYSGADSYYAQKYLYDIDALKDPKARLDSFTEILNTAFYMEEEFDDIYAGLTAVPSTRWGSESDEPLEIPENVLKAVLFGMIGRFRMGSAPVVVAVPGDVDYDRYTFRAVQAIYSCLPASLRFRAGFMTYGTVDQRNTSIVLYFQPERCAPRNAVRLDGSMPAEALPSAALPSELQDMICRIIAKTGQERRLELLNLSEGVDSRYSLHDLDCSRYQDYLKQSALLYTDPSHPADFKKLKEFADKPEQVAAHIRSLVKKHIKKTVTPELLNQYFLNEAWKSASDISAFFRKIQPYLSICRMSAEPDHVFHKFLSFLKEMADRCTTFEELDDLELVFVETTKDWAKNIPDFLASDFGAYIQQKKQDLKKKKEEELERKAKREAEEREKKAKEKQKKVDDWAQRIRDKLEELLKEPGPKTWSTCNTVLTTGRNRLSNDGLDLTDDDVLKAQGKLYDFIYQKLHAHYSKAAAVEIRPDLDAQALKDRSAQLTALINEMENLPKEVDLAAAIATAQGSLKCIEEQLQASGVHLTEYTTKLLKKKDYFEQLELIAAGEQQLYDRAYSEKLHRKLNRRPVTLGAYQEGFRKHFEQELRLDSVLSASGEDMCLMHLILKDLTELAQTTAAITLTGKTLQQVYVEVRFAVQLRQLLVDNYSGNLFLNGNDHPLTQKADILFPLLDSFVNEIPFKKDISYAFVHDFLFAMEQWGYLNREQDQALVLRLLSEQSHKTLIEEWEGAYLTIEANTLEALYAQVSSRVQGYPEHLCSRKPKIRLWEKAYPLYELHNTLRAWRGARNNDKKLPLKLQEQLSEALAENQVVFLNDIPKMVDGMLAQKHNELAKPWIRACFQGKTNDPLLRDQMYDVVIRHGGSSLLDSCVANLEQAQLFHYEREQFSQRKNGTLVVSDDPQVFFVNETGPHRESLWDKLTAFFRRVPVAAVKEETQESDPEKTSQEAEASVEAAAENDVPAAAAEETTDVGNTDVVKGSDGNEASEVNETSENGETSGDVEGSENNAEATDLPADDPPFWKQRWFCVTVAVVLSAAVLAMAMYAAAMFSRPVAKACPEHQLHVPESGEAVSRVELPQETIPNENEPDENQSGENQSDENQSDENQSGENQSDENQSGENQSDENQSDENQSDENQSDENQSDENQSGEDVPEEPPVWNPPDMI